MQKGGCDQEMAHMKTYMNLFMKYFLGVSSKKVNVVGSQGKVSRIDDTDSDSNKESNLSKHLGSNLKS